MGRKANPDNTPKARKAKAAPKSKVVEATGVAVVSSQGVEVAKRIEAAMVRALHEAQASGETDPAKLQEAMLKARDEAVIGG